MTQKTPATCLELFFADMQTHGIWPVLCERQGDGFRHLSKPELADCISECARALAATGTTPHSRVAFYASASIELWIAEWATLASRCVAVFIPAGFSEDEFIETLAESKSRLALVPTLALADRIANLQDTLPDLTHIICFEGSHSSQKPILSWQDFLEMGRTLPDTLKAQIRAIQPNDRAILFHFKNAQGQRQATIYTQAMLYSHAMAIDAQVALQTALDPTAIQVRYKLDGTWRKALSYADDVKANPHYIGNLESVLACVGWTHIAGHLMAYYLPALKGGTIQITGDPHEVHLSEYRPHVIIGEAAYLDAIREQTAGRMRRYSSVVSALFLDLQKLGKRRYESTEAPKLLARVQENLLQALIGRRILKSLGGRVHLVIDVDDAAHYETKLFFHSLGIQFVEVTAKAPIAE